MNRIAIIAAAAALSCSACVQVAPAGTFHCSRDGVETQSLAVGRGSSYAYSRNVWQLRLPNGQYVAYVQQPGEFCAVLEGGGP